MRALSPDLAQALSLVAHTLGDLWTLHAARLGAAAAGKAPSPRLGPSSDSEARPELDALLEEALQVADELTVDALAGLRSEDFELPRVTVACILADRLLPAIVGLSLVLLIHEEGSARAYLR